MSSSQEPQSPNPRPNASPATPPAAAPMQDAVRPHSRRRLIGIIVGAIVAVLVVALVVAAATRGAHKSSSSTSGQGGSGASDAVQSYLEAVAAGDATKALSYAESAPHNTAYLTDAVLKQAMQKSPITDITTTPTPDAKTFTTVNFSYKLGGQPQSGHVSVSRKDDAWKLWSVTRSVFLSGADDLQHLLINGVAAHGANREVDLFPGTYAITSNIPYMATAKTSIVVPLPDGGIQTEDGFAPTLSPAGLQAYKAAVQKKLTSCEAQHSLAPKDCGFWVMADPKADVAPGSVTWQTNGDITKGLTGTLETADPTQIDETTSFVLKASAKDTAGHALTGGSTTITEIRTTVGPKGFDVTFSSI